MNWTEFAVAGVHDAADLDPTDDPDDVLDVDNDEIPDLDQLAQVRDRATSRPYVSTETRPLGDRFPIDKGGPLVDIPVLSEAARDAANPNPTHLERPMRTTAATLTAAAAAAAAAATTPTPPPERTNTAALVGLFAALVGLAPVAIVFGFIGVTETGRRPHESGNLIAYSAAVLGLLELVAAIAFAAAMFE